MNATLNVLVAARDAGVKRLVFAGSSSVYGESATLPKREDMRTAPMTPYALHKQIGEQYCQMFTKLYGLETVTTRYFNVFGPRQQPGSPYSGVISLFIEALASGKAPHVHGDGRQTRDFTFVGDVVTGVLAACHAPKASGEIINVAAGGRISLLELIRTLQVDSEDRRRACPWPGARGRHPRLAGGHRKSPSVARLLAGCAVRRRPAPDRRVVPVARPLARLAVSPHVSQRPI